MNHPNATGHAPRRNRRGYLAGFREVSTALASNSGSTSTGCAQGCRRLVSGRGGFWRVARDNQDENAATIKVRMPRRLAAL